MNWDQFEGKWHQLAGQVKSAWGRLTHDVFQRIAGKKEKLAGRIQERYGTIQQEAEKQIDRWVSKAKHGPGDEA